jgi:hypothetical protein
MRRRLKPIEQMAKRLRVPVKALFEFPERRPPK